MTGGSRGAAARKSRGEETRRLILRTAEEVFAEVGYAGARMDEIAKRVGIRRASFVYYFRDKPALYDALLDDLFADLVASYGGVLEGAGSHAERMLRCVDVWVARVEQRPALLRIALWEIARARASKPVPLAYRVQPIVQLMADAVREGQRDRAFRDDVDPVAFVMSVAGTTAFLGLRTALLGPTTAPPPAPGRLAAELRGWVARVLFVE